MAELTSHSSRRIPELDGLRGIACLMVLVWHYFGVVDLSSGAMQLVSQNLGVPTPGSGSGHASVSWITMLGASGVDLFFVLSGFLISGILFDNTNSPTYFRTFFVRRVCRIFPVYYLVFLSLLLVLPLAQYLPALNIWLLRDLMPLWSYATFTQNIFMAFDSSTNGGGRWIGMTWSVAVEEHFYLLFPFVVRFLSQRAVRDLAVLSIFGAAILRVLADKVGIWYYPLLPCRIDCMAIGVLLAYSLRQPGVAPWLRENRGRIYMAMALSVLGFIFFKDNMLGYTWIAMAFGCVLLLVVIHPETWLASICRWSSLQKVGLLSYGIYMFHQAVNGTMHAAFFEYRPIIRDLATLGVTCVSVGLTLALALASYHLMEKHFLRLGQMATWQPKAIPSEPAAFTKAA